MGRRLHGGGQRAPGAEIDQLVREAVADRAPLVLLEHAPGIQLGGLAVVDVWLPDADDLGRYDGRIVLEYPRRDPETGRLVTKIGSALHDAATGTVYAVAEMTGPKHQLVAIDAVTGAVKFRKDVDPANMVPRDQQQRAALAVANGYVYIAFGGLAGDCGNYHGWVVATQTDGNGPLLDYQVPTTREGAIWAPSGPAVDAAGNITPAGVAAGAQKQCPAGVTEYTKCGYYFVLQGTSMASPAMESKPTNSGSPFSVYVKMRWVTKSQTK